jgi:hypothetical protein
MATPRAIQQAATEAIHAAISSLATCAIYAGEFSGGELSRASVQSPAVLVACLGGTRERDVDCGEVDWKLRYTAYCMARNATGRGTRSIDCLALAESVISVIDGARFGLTGLFPAKCTRLDNMYAEAFDKGGVALWAVTWEQVARLGADEWSSDGIAVSEVYLGIAPDIGAAHEDDYRQVYPESEDPQA